MSITCDWASIPAIFFTEQPDKTRDVEPIVEMFKKVNPTKISLTLDPEGSGPDTHYKVLQATAAAVKKME